MKNKEVWSFRGDLSPAARKNVEMVQAKMMLTGNKITQAEALDMIAKNIRKEQIEKIVKSSSVI